MDRVREVIDENSYDNLMFDLETLSTKCNGVILSIGGCFFNIYGRIGPSFNFYPDIREQVRKGRVFDHKTIAFWLDSPEYGKKLIGMPSEQRTSLAYTASQLNFVIETNTSNMYKYNAWARGKEFDLSILKHFWVDTCENKIEPWYFRSTRDLRDLQTIIVDSGGKEVYDNIVRAVEEETKTFVKHNSEHDAIRQAKIVVHCQRWLDKAISDGLTYQQGRGI